MRRAESNGVTNEVFETYAPDLDRIYAGSGSVTLNELVKRSTTATADGGSQSVEELQTRDLISPREPLRLVRRTITNVRSAGPGRWTTERRQFEMDPNRRLVLTVNELEESSDK
jgi:hypothetical protein